MSEEKLLDPESRVKEEEKQETSCKQVLDVIFWRWACIKLKFIVLVIGIAFLVQWYVVGTSDMYEQCEDCPIGYIVEKANNASCFYEMDTRKTCRRFCQMIYPHQDEAFPFLIIGFILLMCVEHIKPTK